MSNENEDETSMEFWRTKCMKLEKVIKTLSNHCVRVVEHHEDLLVKFKKNQDQYERLRTKCKERGEQIKQARDVLIPVSNELKMLREKYEVAVRCQMEAESFAIETTNKNKKLHRQSQALSAKLGFANVVEISIDDDVPADQEGDEEEKKYLEKLGQKIDDLEEEKTTLNMQIRDLTENYQDECAANGRLRERIDAMKEELQQAKTTIKEQTELLQKVAVTSEMAAKEYQDMEQTYKKEFMVRNEAERFAKRLCAERDQARRESSMALGKIADNKKLMEAMMEIQDLNAQIAQLKEDFDKQSHDFEEQIKAAKEVYDAEALEAETEELTAEKTALQEKLEKNETELADLRSKYTNLQEIYKALETKYDTVMAVPPPPPPPPPPMMKVGGFLSKIVGRKGHRDRAKEQLKKGGVALNDNHSKAVEEMMSRIKSGNIGLRPVLQSRRTQSLPEKEEPSAMNELQGLLSKMKKARSEDDLSVFDETGASDDSELGRIFRRRQQLSQEALTPTPSPKQLPKPSEPQHSPRPMPAPRKLSTIRDEADES